VLTATVFFANRIRSSCEICLFPSGIEGHTALGGNRAIHIWIDSTSEAYPVRPILPSRAGWPPCCRPCCPQQSSSEHFFTVWITPSRRILPGYGRSGPDCRVSQCNRREGDGREGGGPFITRSSRRPFPVTTKSRSPKIVRMKLISKVRQRRDGERGADADRRCPPGKELSVPES
jgi:hypothetical protein